VFVTFCKHKQRFVYIKKNDKSLSIWVSNERSGDLAWDGSGEDRLSGDWSGRDGLVRDGSVGVGRGLVRRGQGLVRVGQGRVGWGWLGREKNGSRPSFNWL
jgi:hypothetical protein